MPDTFNRRHGYWDTPLCDSHIHLTNLMRVTDTERVFETCARFFGIERLCLLALPHSTGPDDPSNNLKALWLKLKLGEKLGSDRAYAFCGLWHHFDRRDTPGSLRDQLARLMDMGFDGYKTLMGKPPLRKRLGVPLCDDLFDGVWSYCEKAGVPVTMHLGDPGQWWEKGPDGQVPAYDGAYLPLSQARDEVETILKKHPDLDLLLCHFYFIADDPEGARTLMARHPNVRLDITPGGEMYAHFSRQPDEWRDFFRLYRRRILFGSDTDNWAVPATLSDYDPWFRYPFKLVKDSMERHEPFEDHDWGTLNPVDPGRDVLEDIYHDNFLRRMGAPRAIDRRALNEVAGALLSTAYREYTLDQGDQARWACDRLSLTDMRASLA